MHSYILDYIILNRVIEEGLKMSDYKLLNYEELTKEEYQSILQKIEEKYSLIMDLLLTALKENPNQGVREDVLELLAARIDDLYKISSKCNFERFLKEMMLNHHNYASEWYEWFIACFLQDGFMDLDSFMFALEKAAERELELDEVKDIFDNTTKNIQCILTAINEYVPRVKDVIVPEDTVQLIENDYHEKEVVRIRQYDMSSIFDNMLEVVARQTRENESVSNYQSDLNAILMKFQLATTELNNYSSEIFRAWEKDKDRINQLESMCNIQKQAIKNQQNTIDDLEEEIKALRKRLHEAEKRDIKRTNLSYKLFELQGMMNDIAMEQNDDYNG